MSESDTILTATRAAHVDHNGQSVLIRPGTTVRVGHPLAESYPGLFEPIRVQYDVVDVDEGGRHERLSETADATPPPAPAAKPARGGKATETR